MVAFVLAQREVEGRARTNLAFSPDSPSVPHDDPMHGRQSDSSSFELTLRVEALEWREELAGVLHVEAGAIVANDVRCLPFMFRPTELDPGIATLRRELPGVTQEVFQDDGNQSSVALCVDALRALEADVALRAGRPLRFHDSPGESAEVDVAASYPRARHACEAEQVIDQLGLR